MIPISFAVPRQNDEYRKKRVNILSNETLSAINHSSLTGDKNLMKHYNTKALLTGSADVSNKIKQSEIDLCYFSFFVCPKTSFPGKVEFLIVW